MPRVKTSARGRKKNTDKVKLKTQSRGRGRPKKTEKKWSPISDTSPFKGFPQSSNLSPFKRNENIKAKKLFEDLKEHELEPSQIKENMFDALLDPSLRNNLLNKNIRTYKNKRKIQPENHLLVFQDSKNRENIIQWLNDNRNFFDRLSQTQTTHYSSDEDDVPFNMPSVSQVNTMKSKMSSSKSVKRSRSPYRLRARSLDIHVKKNGLRGRNKRYSLAGDTPSMEDYHIEEILTDDGAPVPAKEHVKLLVDLEDECVDILENEMLQNAERSNQSVEGWDRIKDFNKTLNNNKKQPKELKILKITLQASQNKKDEVGQNNPVFYLDELENYFKENMEKMINTEVRSNQEVTVDKFSLREVLNVGNNFINMLKDVAHKHTDGLSELQPMIHQLRNLINSLNSERENISEKHTQTFITETYNKNIQTNFVEFKETEIQTEEFQCQNCINNNNVIQKKFPSITFCDKNIQVQVEKNNVEIQTSQKLLQILQNIQRVTSHTSGTTTPSDIFIPWSEIENKACAIENKTNNLNNKIKETVNETEANNILDDALDDLYFDTEEVFQSEINKNESPKLKKPVEINITINVPSSNESIVCSTEVNNEDGSSKGVKRVLSTSPVNDTDRSISKRPCNKFIQNDLTVAFDSCPETEDNKPQVNEIIELDSDESDEASFDEYIDSVMKKYDRKFSEKKDKPKSERLETKTRSQQDIEDYEEIIRNATKPPPEKTEKSPESSPSATDSDVIFIEAEANLTKIERDLDYFNTHSSPIGVKKTPKSKKRLFDSPNHGKNDKFSESLFDSAHNESTAINRTLTRDNVDILMKEVGEDSAVEDSKVDEEVQEILTKGKCKINILQHVIVKGGDDEENGCVDEGDDDDDGYDVDVVESTPQKKKVASFTEQSRCDAMLDITLPPPLEFQDVAIEEPSKVEPIPVKNPSPPRRPLAPLNKITSTPLSHKEASEILSLSPVTLDNKRALGPIEMAQRSKFSPLTIIKTTHSQKSAKVSSTPRQRSILNYVRASQESQGSQGSPSSSSKPCIACSRISRDQVMAISALTNKKLATYSSSFSKKVTHMIVSVNHQNRIKDHTIKSISAIAAGIWVLSFDWVQECLAKNSLVPEEPYEVLDVSGIPGPKKARTTRAANPLLRGYKIHVSPPFLTTLAQDIENIVKMLGGKVVPSPEDLLDKDNYICLIVTEQKATQDCDIDKFDTWLEVLRVATVDLEWLSRSVGQYQVQSLLPFTLCSEDFLDTLGYPPELLSNVPVSFMQSTSSVQ